MERRSFFSAVCSAVAALVGLFAPRRAQSKWSPGTGEPMVAIEGRAGEWTEAHFGSKLRSEVTPGMIRRTFEIEFPEENGPLWMNTDNLLICLTQNYPNTAFSVRDVTGDGVPQELRACIRIDRSLRVEPLDESAPCVLRLS